MVTLTYTWQYVRTISALTFPEVKSHEKKKFFKISEFFHSYLSF